MKRGEVLAKKAIQRKWQEIVVEENIFQATNPERLIDIIDSVPGVFDLLKESIDYTICYAPQLTIKGFEGLFESQIEKLYKIDVERHEKNASSDNGTALTIHEKPPSCSIEYALRDPNFGFYKPANVTCQFVQGELMGPSPRVFDHFEYLVWLLSRDSDWLPQSIKNYLLDGFLDWNVWSWYDAPRRSTDDMKKTDVTGALRKQMHNVAKENTDFKMNDDSMRDIHERLDWSIKLLELDDTVEEIAYNFIDGGFIESCVDEYREKNVYG